MKLANGKQFVTGGKALFTILNTKTGGRFTYKVKACEDRPELSFVSVLNGPDNYTNYKYIGVIRAGEFGLTAKSKISPDAPSVKAFKWFWDHLVSETLPACVEIHHEGKCGRCGRVLTVPESIQTGFGPDCAELLGIRAA